MIRRPALVLVLVATMTVAGFIPARARDKAFDVSEQDFFRRVKTVVLASCKFPAEFDDSDTLRARADSVRWQLDSLLVREFQAAGFSVVSGREAAAIHAQIVDSLGGLYDAVTGQVDTARFATAERLSRATIENRFHQDAIAFPTVFVTRASFLHAQARWHGVTEKLTDESFGGGFMKRLKFKDADGDYNGMVPALSIFISIDAGPGATLYSWSGGLQALTRMKNAQLVPVAKDLYLADRGRVENGVRVALEPLRKASNKYASGK